MSLKTLSLGGVDFTEDPTITQYVTVRTGPGENDWANVLLGDFRSFMTSVVNQRIDQLIEDGVPGGGEGGPATWPIARTLTLSGSLSGSTSFDGTADFTLAATVNDDALTIAKTSGLQAALDGKLASGANAVSASKLQTSRTLALSGLVTGSVGFDGSTNATIATAIADGALSVAKTTGLQTALDAKAGIGDSVRFNTVAVGADTDVLYYEDPNELGSGMIRTGTTGAYKYFNFNLNGNFNVLSGTVTVGAAKNPVWHAGNLTPGNLGYLAVSAVTHIANAGVNVNNLTAGSKVQISSTGNTNTPGLSASVWYIETLQAATDTSVLIQRAYSPVSDHSFERRCVSGAWSAWRQVWNSGTFDPTSKLDSNGVATSASKLQTARAIGLTGVIAATGVNFDGTGAINLTTTIADAALTIAKTSGLQAALDLKASRASPTFTGVVTLAGDMLPDQDNVRSLGSETLMWRDVYIGPGSLYINGQKVLQETAGTIQMTADPGQNISVQTTGTGDIELAPQGTGVIQLKGPISFLGGSKIRTSNGSALLFDEDLNFTAGNGLTGTVTINANTAWHAGNQLALGTTAASARTALQLGALATAGAGSVTTLIRGDGSAGNTLANDLQLTAATTESRSMKIGTGRTGDGTSYLDLIGDSTYTDYGLRLVRGSGAGGSSSINHRGAGGFYLDSLDGGPIYLRQGGVNRLSLGAGGALSGAQQRDLLPSTAAAAGWVKIGSQSWTTTASRILKFEMLSGSFGARRTAQDFVTVSTRDIASNTTALTQTLVDQMVEHLRLGLSDSFLGGAQIGLTLTPDGSGGYTGVDIYVRLDNYNSQVPLSLTQNLNSNYVRDFTLLTTEPTNIIYATPRGILNNFTSSDFTTTGVIMATGGVGTYNPNNSQAAMRMDWNGDAPRLRLVGSGAGSAGTFSIQGTSNFNRMTLDAAGNAVFAGSVSATSFTGTVASATTATKLATPRNINGVAFDGSGDISITAALPPVLTSFVGAFATQQINIRQGYNNGVTRWATVMESDASWAMYSYDTSGATPTRMLNLVSPVAGGASTLSVAGNLTLAPGLSEAQVNLTPTGGGSRAIRLVANATPNTGLYDVSNSAWLMRIDSANDMYLANNLNVPIASAINFGNGTRQMLNLWATQYGIGVQGNTLYFRSGGPAGAAGGFAWHKSGVHSNTALDPGTGGTMMMNLTGDGDLKLSSNNVVFAGAFQNSATGLNPSASAAGAAFRAGGSYGGGFGLVDGNYGISMYSTSGTLNFGFGSNTSISMKAQILADGGANFSRVYAGYDAQIAGSMSCANWFRSIGETGWYSATYGGGIYMQDTTYVRVYNGRQMAAADFVISSDKRLKKDIRPFEFRGRLRPVNFSLIDTDAPDIGFLADDVKRLYPEAVGEYVKDHGHLKGKKVKQLSQAKLTAVVSYQVNRAEDNIVKLEKSNAKLVKENGSLKARLARLEKQVAKLVA